MTERYIIEHPLRGVVVDQDHDPYGDSLNVYKGIRTTFSVARPRTEAEVYFNTHQAVKALNAIHPRLRQVCQIRHFGGQWEPVQWDSAQ